MLGGRPLVGVRDWVRAGQPCGFKSHRFRTSRPKEVEQMMQRDQNISLVMFEKLRASLFQAVGQGDTTA
jgi:hypothetical protein